MKVSKLERFPIGALGQTAVSSEIVFSGDTILPESTTWKSGTGGKRRRMRKLSAYRTALVDEI